MFSSNLNTELKAAGFSPDDIVFLTSMCGRFPEIRNRFELSATYPPSYREIFATFGLQDTLRTGWGRIGIPKEDIQTVSDHMGTCMIFAQHLYQDIHVIEMMGVHDLGEYSVTDFTPYDPITPNEKHRLEKLGLTFIFSQSARKDRQISLWLEFEEQQTPTSHKGYDIDKLEMVMQAQLYEPRYPHLKESLDGFWTYVDARLKTPEGRVLFEDLKQNHPNPHPLKLHLSHPYVRPWTVDKLPPQQYPTTP